MAKIRVFFIFVILLSSSFFVQVARSQSDSEPDTDDELVAETIKEAGDSGIVSDDTQDFGFRNFNSAPGVETVCVFPKNFAKLVVAGQETELLIGMKNEGEQSVKVIAVHASVHLPYDHRMLVQNLSTVAFNNASVPASVQATFPYIFAVSKFLQPGTFDLVGNIVYEIDQKAYQNTFYNDTIEFTEAGGFVSVETVFLVSLGLALLVLTGLWVRTQLQSFSKRVLMIDFFILFSMVKAGKGITDHKSSLENIFADNLVETKDDFLKTFSTESHYIKSMIADGKIISQNSSNEFYPFLSFIRLFVSRGNLWAFFTADWYHLFFFLLMVAIRLMLLILTGRSIFYLRRKIISKILHQNSSVLQHFTVFSITLTARS